jgi:hypothetical protein
MEYAQVQFVHQLLEMAGAYTSVPLRTKPTEMISYNLVVCNLLLSIIPKAQEYGKQSGKWYLTAVPAILLADWWTLGIYSTTEISAVIPFIMSATKVSRNGFKNASSSFDPTAEYGSSITVRVCTSYLRTVSTDLIAKMVTNTAIVVSKGSGKTRLTELLASIEMTILGQPSRIASTIVDSDDFGENLTPQTLNELLLSRWKSGKMRSHEDVKEVYKQVGDQLLAYNRSVPIHGRKLIYFHDIAMVMPYGWNRTVQLMETNLNWSAAILSRAKAGNSHGLPAELDVLLGEWMRAAFTEKPLSMAEIVHVWTAHNLLNAFHRPNFICMVSLSKEQLAENGWCACQQEPHITLFLAWKPDSEMSDDDASALVLTWQSRVDVTITDEIDVFTTKYGDRNVVNATILGVTNEMIMREIVKTMNVSMYQNYHYTYQPLLEPCSHVPGTPFTNKNAKVSFQRIPEEYAIKTEPEHPNQIPAVQKLFVSVTATGFHDETLKSVDFDNLVLLSNALGLEAYMVVDNMTRIINYANSLDCGEELIMICLIHGAGYEVWDGYKMSTFQEFLEVFPTWVHLKVLFITCRPGSYDASEEAKLQNLPANVSLILSNDNETFEPVNIKTGTGLLRQLAESQPHTFRDILDAIISTGRTPHVYGRWN